MHHQIHYDNTNGVGMGDLLCFISLICSAPNPVEILVSNDHGTYDKLTMFKRVLNIPDYRFIVTLKDSVGTFHNYGWPLKLFSDYFLRKKILSGEVIRDDIKQWCASLANTN
jgi:hypothetical protein